MHEIDGEAQMEKLLFPSGLLRRMLRRTRRRHSVCPSPTDTLLWWVQREVTLFLLLIGGLQRVELCLFSNQYVIPWVEHTIVFDKS
jgi:hypothetical protein